MASISVIEEAVVLTTLHSERLERYAAGFLISHNLFMNKNPEDISEETLDKTALYQDKEYCSFMSNFYVYVQRN